ncbi:MAG: hypothetical protein GY951_08030 [Psychromonas sp.]|nr:hypothetical protein [Psychromonas sp.]
MEKSQNGFVLISVLLITTISTIFALNEIQGNQLQERIGGNQQKELNARYMAEKGVFKAYEQIKLAQANGDSVDLIGTNLPANASGANFTVNVVNINSGATPTYLEFMSTGEVDGATAFLKAKIELSSGFAPPLFGAGIVGCEGVVVKGNGSSDSYDSTEGAYGVDGNVGENGDVATIMQDADIVIGGKSAIAGSVKATGKVLVNGSSSVAGEVKANGDVDLVSDGTLNVGGAINSGGHVFATNNTIGGDVTANGQIEDGANIAAGKTANSGKTDIVAVLPAEGCDNAGYAKEYYKQDNNGNPLKAYDEFTSNGDLLVNSTELVFTGANYIDENDQSVDAIKVAILEDSNKNVHVFNDFTLNVDQKIKASGGGEVFIVVQGDFLMKSSSKIEVEKGTTLTFLVMGTIQTKDDSVIKEVANSDVNSTAKSPATTSVVQFFSVHEEPDSTAGTWSTGDEHFIEDGVVKTKARDDKDYKNMLSVSMQGKDVQATVHAPRGHVEITASGHFYGSVRGKTAYSNGDGAMHFDEKLLDDQSGGDPVAPSVKFAYIYYRYQ